MTGCLKIAASGVDSRVVLWIREYLIDRSQRARVGALTIQNYQRDALNIIYSSNITLLYMFRVSSTHPQEDTVVHKQHMVPSLSIRVLVSC